MNNILITGGTSPLGGAIAKFFARKKYNVIVTSRKQNNNFSKGINCVGNIDLLKQDCLFRLREVVEESFESKFTLINTVGYFPKDGHQPFLSHSKLELDKIITSNYVTVSNTIQELLPVMIEKGGGHIIGISCNSVNYNFPWMIPFTAAKAALEALIKGISNEYAKNEIIANVLSLATLQTEVEKNLKPFGDYDNWLNTIEVAKTIEGLISNENNYLNGNVIKLFKHSDSFFYQSYFERIKQ